jgi:tetratricopeptide (TPR) repeat protein
MADNEKSKLAPPNPEQRRIATSQYDRANQVLASGNYDYAIQLLISCCKIDPANLIYRRALRIIEKTKYKNNLHGSRLAFMSTGGAKAKIKTAKRRGDYLKVLEHGEQVLAKNPWDTGAQMDMADAADKLGELDLAVWILEQARQKDQNDVGLNRTLARLYEKRGSFNQAIELWELIKQAKPNDLEARNKCQDLAATETITRGKYDAAPENPDEGNTEKTPDEITAQPSPIAAEPPVPEPVPDETAKLQARIDADPTNAHAYLRLAGAHREADRLEQARTVLEQGLGPTANHFELIMELAEIEVEVLRRDLVQAERKLKDSPQDDELRKLRARMQKEINSRELELYRQKADRYPANKAHHFELGIRLLRAGNVEEAIGEFQGVRGSPRYQWRALSYLGHCFRTRKSWRLAQRNFEEALQHCPEEDATARKEILYQLAQVSAEAGDLTRAVEAGNELANRDPKFRDIAKLTREWQVRQK